MVTPNDSSFQVILARSRKEQRRVVGFILAYLASFTYYISIFINRRPKYLNNITLYSYLAVSPTLYSYLTVFRTLYNHSYATVSPTLYNQLLYCFSHSV